MTGSSHDPSAIGTPEIRPGPFTRHDDVSRTWFRDEADFPGPRTMTSAAHWLDVLAPQDAPFLLVVDEFDPARAGARVRRRRHLGADPCASGR